MGYNARRKRSVAAGMPGIATVGGIITGCLLSKYTGGNNNFINSIPGYVAENIDKVSIDV